MLNQRSLPVNSGARPSTGRPALVPATAAACDSTNPEAAPQVIQLPLDRPGALQAAGGVDHHRGKLVGERGLEADVEVGGHGDRGERPSPRRAHAGRPGRGRRPAAGRPPGARRRRAAGAPAPSPRRRPARRSRCGPTLPGWPTPTPRRRESGPRRGRRQSRAQRRAAGRRPARRRVRRRAGPEPGQPRERRLDARGQRGDEQRQPEAEQHEDGQGANGPVGQPDAVDQRGEGHDGERERGHAGRRSPRPAAADRRCRPTPAARAAPGARTGSAPFRRRRRTRRERAEPPHSKHGWSGLRSCDGPRAAMLSRTRRERHVDDRGQRADAVLRGARRGRAAALRHGAGRGHAGLGPAGPGLLPPPPHGHLRQPRRRSLVDGGGSLRGLRHGRRFARAGRCPRARLVPPARCVDGWRDRPGSGAHRPRPGAHAHPGRHLRRRRRLGPGAQSLMGLEGPAADIRAAR